MKKSKKLSKTEERRRAYCAAKKARYMAKARTLGLPLSLPRPLGRVCQGHDGDFYIVSYKMRPSTNVKGKMFLQPAYYWSHFYKQRKPIKLEVVEKKEEHQDQDDTSALGRLDETAATMEGVEHEDLSDISELSSEPDGEAE